MHIICSLYSAHALSSRMVSPGAFPIQLWPLQIILSNSSQLKIPRVAEMRVKLPGKYPARVGHGNNSTILLRSWVDHR